MQYRDPSEADQDCVCFDDIDVGHCFKLPGDDDYDLRMRVEHVGAAKSGWNTVQLSTGDVTLTAGDTEVISCPDASFTHR